jgi:hypothetical protein
MNEDPKGYAPIRVGASLQSLAFERRVTECIAMMIQAKQEMVRKHGAVVVEEARQRLAKLHAEKGIR